MRKTCLVPALVLVILPLAAGQASAFNSYIAAWRASYPDACTPIYQLAMECVLCHGGGFSLNAYGDDLASNNIDFDLVGLLDSDGDGRTNDEEINLDCTVPADATSADEGSTWSGVKVLFD